MSTYAWRTDAASGSVESSSVEEAVVRLVADGEWAPEGSSRELREIGDGAWLLIHDADGAIVHQRGSCDGPRLNG